MTARHSRGPRLFLSDVRFVFSPDTPQLIDLPSEQSHYVRDVLRLGVGDRIEIGDSTSGVVAAGTLTNLNPLVSVQIDSLLDSRSSARKIILLCALCKGEKNEQIIDWATELGCIAVHFWQSSRSIVRLRNEQERARKAERFTKIALAASQQSRQARPPAVALHTSLEAALDSLPHVDTSLKAICSLSPGACPMSSLLESTNTSAPIVIAIGPEGDFAPEEEALLTTRHAFAPISLGSSILRSELAVVSAIISVRIHDERCANTN